MDFLHRGRAVNNDARHTRQLVEQLRVRAISYSELAAMAMFLYCSE